MNFMKMFSKKQVVVGGLLSALMVSSAWATTAGGGVTGTEFQALFDMLVGWAEGYLGKALAIAAFVSVHSLASPSLPPCRRWLASSSPSCSALARRSSTACSPL